MCPYSKENDQIYPIYVQLTEGCVLITYLIPWSFSGFAERMFKLVNSAGNRFPCKLAQHFLKFNLTS